MNAPAAKTRFAPSPTGRLHLGNVRTALFNALLARRLGGHFLLRIEDTDRERSAEAHVRALEEDLRWLGLDWQEGPGVEGAAGPYFQSQRTQRYETLYETLRDRGLAYPCFCTERELALSRKTQLAAGQPPRYPGTCAHLDSEAVQRRLDEGRTPTLRFRVEPGRVVTFDDAVKGTQRFRTDEIGDFIIRRADGSAAFFFSNAVDDAAMGVTHVLRGEDHLTNTPRQLLLLEALDLASPVYGHIAMIVGDDGAPLSKRHGSRSVAELRESGYLPLAINNYLARLGHYYADNSLMDLDTLAARFELAQLGSAPARYDEQQLRHWQREAVAASDASVLEAWMPAEYRERLGPEGARAFIAAVRANVGFPGELAEWSRRLLDDLPPLDDDARAVVEAAGVGFFEHAERALDEAGTDYGAFIAALKRDSAAKGKALFLPVRVALTGLTRGPELGAVMPLMSAARVRQRLATCRTLAENAAAAGGQ
ncbi:glutamate--tRNA ligase [Ectothiorhodospiraceae bacterium WFHF3C12]|nr:glutamate--tRNA ligase [Ectothiorhodospiraceae bacterium WFHF3C12]